MRKSGGTHSGNWPVPFQEIRQVKDTWTAIGSSIGIRVHCFESEEHLKEKKDLAKVIPVFVDYKLGNNDGREACFNLMRQGFTNVALATGEAKQVHPQLRQVDKKFPIKEFKL